MRSYIGDMKRIGVRELNQYTSRVIDRVKHGEIVEVTERGRLVARVVPVETDLSILDRMVAGGRAIAPELVDEPWRLPPVLGDPKVNVAEEVTAARRGEGRW
jgi:prevent-host-death family protein